MICADGFGPRAPGQALMLTAAAGPRLAAEGWVRMDYLAKPFESVELIARVQVLARRQAPGQAAGPEGGRDPARSSDQVGEPLRPAAGLARKEFGVLEVLLAAEGRR
jgi:DNA-binding response OmpR family regulator